MNDQEMKNYPLLMNVEEAAAFLRVGKATVYNLIRCGQLSHIRIGRKFFVNRVTLLQFIGIAEA